ncbi:MAG: RNA polymerase factor sigma-54 [Phycisphaerales bacterium]|nr:RNA polymerase factor sigma-54 [Phycisphaerales bacterium]
MRFDASQQMRLGQHMKLAPRMIQSMEILQMAAHELEERIEQELESNVTLEVMEPDIEGERTTAENAQVGGVAEGRVEDRPLEAGEAADDFERLDSYEQSNPEALENEYSASDSTPSRDDYFERATRTRDSGEPDAKSEAMANTAARGASLIEQLLDQWRMAEVEESLRRLGSQIISFIEDDGYLRTDLATIIDRMPAGMERPTTGAMSLALRAVQLLLEPAGVAARDVREALLLQIDSMAAHKWALSPQERERWPLIRRIVADYLEDLSQNRLPKLAEKLGVGVSDVKDAIEQMRRLSMAPARELVTESAGVIFPDAIVEFDEEEDRYIAYLAESRIGNLRLNQEYAKMARDRGVPKPTREFLKRNISNAAWLIDAVEQRRRTLLRVISVVVDAQRDYFDYGAAHLRPLPMTQVADQLGIHVATVSRAVADKYLQTPRGVVPLRGFFSGGTQTESGEDVSWNAVKAALKEIIDVEDKRSPLSDETLAEKLKERGIEIARRTVAKYRDQLNVPSARLRKLF